MISSLRKSPLSINIDECTASNGMFSQFSSVALIKNMEDSLSITINKFIECINISAELFSGEIPFAVDDIPSENLISCLSYSAGVYLIKICALIKMILNFNFH